MDRISVLGLFLCKKFSLYSSQIEPNRLSVQHLSRKKGKQGAIQATSVLLLLFSFHGKQLWSYRNGQLI